MSLPIIVLGAGGHARVLIDALLAASAPVAGVVDPDPALSGTSVLGVPVLGGDAAVGNYAPSEIRLVNGVGSVGLPALRQKLYERFSALGYQFASVIHPSAVVARDVELAAGVQIMAGAVLQTGCRIGVNSIVNTRASVDHDCSVGAHVHIAPGVTLSGGVQLGNCVHIGTGATLIQGVCVGPHCLIAAGAVVVGDLSAGARVRGVPAKEFT